MYNEHGVRCYICNKVLTEMEERSYKFLDGTCQECAHIIYETKNEIDEILVYKKMDKNKEEKSK